MDTPTPPDDGTIVGGVEVTPSGRTPKTPAGKSRRSRAQTSRAQRSRTAGQSRSTAGRVSRAGILEPGEELGPRFVIEALLGEGGMGRVYKVYDKELDRYVALKVLLPELASDPQIIQRFKHELLLASKISHKNILRIHDLSEADGVKFITMAFVEGQDLHDILKKERPLPLDRAIKFARQLCEALEAAHHEGVVHRDFKPHNVLVSAGDQVYVSDFGLATSFETAKMGMTRSGAFVGTPRYMAPEQVEGGTIDHRSDLYSLGLVMYEMVTGDVPFAGESTWQVMYQRVKEKPKDPRLIKPDLPDWVSRVIMHCLERDPALRYQTAREILADIDAHRSPSVPRGMRFRLPTGTWRWLVSGAAGVLLTAGVLLGIPSIRHWIFGSNAAGLNPSGLPPLSQGKFIAVLPFRVLGTEGSLNYVADGLGEALSAKLFQLNDVRVASAAAAAKENDQKTPLTRIAKNLGVNYIVHGLIQGAGDKIRIVVNLENMVDNKLQWSQEFSGVTGDLLTLEDNIYAKLTEALQTKTPNSSVAASHPTENVAAYDLYLRGRTALRSQQDLKNVQAAINYFEDAIKKDSSFALAYAGTSDASRIMYHERKDSFWAQKSLAAAEQALRLNPNLPEVHIALGSIYNATGKNAEAVSELQNALKLAPNSDDAYLRLGDIYLSSGQGRQAVEAFQKAIDVNPYYWFNYNELGRGYSQTGEYEKALGAFRHVTELEPDNFLGYLNVGAVYFEQGKYEECITYFQKSLQLQPDAKTYSNLGVAYFYLKRYPESVPMFEKAVELSPNNETFTGNLADAYRWSNQRDRAVATYAKAINLAYKELAVNPRNSDALGSLALYYAKKGDATEATNFIRRARTINPADVSLIYQEAVVYAVNNSPDQAFKSLREALTKGYSLKEAMSDPELGSLQSRPEFLKIVKEFSKPG
ncbi:MAG TPA: tetratricopeptide repeat protein [Candidatus Acidoferrum sp.]|nr:tetratricopeptide repeat protein [Candidatus Acidoferrum sp.]